MPSIRALSTELVINPNTVAKAYQKLDDMGVIYNQRGIGYFVSDNVSSIINDKNQKTQDEFLKTAKMLLKSGKTKQDLINTINGLEEE